MSVRGLLVAVVVLGILGRRRVLVRAQEGSTKRQGGERRRNKLVNVKDEDVRKVEIRRRDASPLVIERDKSNQWQMKSPETWRVDQDEAGGIGAAYSRLSYDRIVEEKAGGSRELRSATPCSGSDLHHKGRQDKNAPDRR